MKNLSFRPISSIEVGKKEFKVECPHCKRTLALGTYLVSMWVKQFGEDYLVTQKVTHHCCSEPFLIPEVYPTAHGAEEIAMMLTELAKTPNLELRLIRAQLFLGSPENN